MSTSESSRREFLLRLATLAGASVLPQAALIPGTIARQQPAATSDEEVCNRTFDLAVERNLTSKPIAEVMAAIGQSFLGTPYLANALEVPGKERLVINLRGLDCVTFVENTLALSRCVKLGKATFDDYAAQLQLIRYRGGIIDEYPSRLHYFTDWIHDNAGKAIVRDMTADLGGVPHTKTINFMSANRSSYKHLVNDSYYESILAAERALNSRQRYYVPKTNVAGVEEMIHNGDILGMTTSIEGLDMSHTGMALWVDGTLKYLHAPLSGGSVQISRGSLPEYLAAHSRHTGIMIARPLEPAG